MLQFIVDGEVAFNFSRAEMITNLISIFGVYLAGVIALFVLMSIGLRKLAINNGGKHVKLAFVPFARWYIFEGLIGSTRIFGKEIKKVGLFATIIFALSFVFQIAYAIIQFLPYIQMFVNNQTMIFEFVADVGFVLQADVEFSTAYEVISRALMIITFALDIMVILVQVSVYFRFYSKFEPFKALLFTLLSIFLTLNLISVAGSIIIFVLRNRKVVDINEFLRMRGYGGAQRPSSAEQPFSEYGHEQKPDDKSDEPFDF